MISIKSAEAVTSTPPAYFKKWHLNQQLVINIEGVLSGQFVDFFSDVQDGVISTVVRLNEDNVFVCDVPNILLTRDYNIRVSIDVTDADGNIVSSYSQVFCVEDARKPDNYVYTETPVVRRHHYYHDTYPVFTKRFKVGTAAKGSPVVMSENDKVKMAGNGTAPVGILLEKFNSFGLVLVSGEIAIEYTEGISLGWNSLVSNGSGGLRLAASDETGRMCLVTSFFDDTITTPGTTYKKMKVILL